MFEYLEKTAAENIAVTTNDEAYEGLIETGFFRLVILAGREFFLAGDRFTDMAKLPAYHSGILREATRD